MRPSRPCVAVGLVDGELGHALELVPLAVDSSGAMRPGREVFIYDEMLWVVWGSCPCDLHDWVTKDVQVPLGGRHYHAASHPPCWCAAPADGRVEVQADGSVEELSLGACRIVAEAWEGEFLCVAQ